MSESDSTSLPARISASISELLSNVPATRERAVPAPAEAALEMARKAARHAAMVSGALAIPPGPLGMLTVLPDIVAIWRIQAQLVADIGGLFGRSTEVTRAHMLYCLFRHAASQAVRDLAVRAGQRLVIGRLGPVALSRVIPGIGASVAARLLKMAAARWVPLAGAAAVAGYAYYDTIQVARTAIEVMRAPIGAVAYPTGATDPLERFAVDGFDDDDSATGGLGRARGPVGPRHGR